LRLIGEVGAVSTFITVEGGDAIGRGGQGLDQRAQTVRQHLVSLVQEMEHSRQSWQGTSGSSFEAAKRELFAKFDQIFVSLSAIAAGLGKSQTHVTTSDTTAAGNVSSASGQIESSFSRPVNVNI
jgi:uncharacterized protein YukE